MKKGLLLLSLVMMCLPLMAEQRTASEAIYNTAGALVSRDAATMLPAGVYVVIADGKSFKVVVK